MRHGKVRCRELRKNMTDAERKLWRALRRCQTGYRFRRQHPIALWIVDFACLEKRLIIELDGSQHMQMSDHDKQRTQSLNRLGWRVMRFWNHDVVQKTAHVCDAILRVLQATPSRPPPASPRALSFPVQPRLYQPLKPAR